MERRPRELRRMEAWSMPSSAPILDGAVSLCCWVQIASGFSEFFWRFMVKGERALLSDFCQCFVIASVVFMMVPSTSNKKPSNV